MHTHLFLLPFLLILSLASCQSRQINSMSTQTRWQNRHQADLLKHSTLLVVINDTIPLDSTLQSEIQQHWSFCKTKFITPQQIPTTLKPTDFVLKFDPYSRILPSSGMGYPGYVIYNGKRSDYLEGNDVLTIVPSQLSISKKDSLNIFQENKELFTHFYILRLQEQLEQLDKRKSHRTKPWQLKQTVYFEDKSRAKKSRLYILDDIQADKTDSIAKQLGIPAERVQVVSWKEMKTISEKKDPNDLFIYEKQYNAYTDGRGTGYYAYASTGEPVVVTALLNREDQKALARERRNRVWAIAPFAGSMVLSAAVYGAMIWVWSIQP
jgi:hypothetical protein